MSFMVSPTGADHCVTTPDGLLANENMFKGFHPLGWLKAPAANDLSPRKVAIFRESQLQNIMGDSLVFCQFPNLTFDQAVGLIKGVTGWDTGIPELLRIAERIVTLMRLFNLREGFTAENDALPERFYQPTTNGALANLNIDRSAYEKARQLLRINGWDYMVFLYGKVAELDSDNNQ
jgi:aldehyde:ferredoxin oxidoreductase